MKNTSIYYSLFFFFNTYSQSILISNTTSISYHGIVFQNLGKVQYITDYHNLVIPVNSELIIHSSGKLLGKIKECKDLIEKHEHYLNSYYLLMLDNIIKEIKAVFDKYMRYINSNNYKSIHSNGNLDSIINEIETRTNINDKKEINIINNYLSMINISTNGTTKIDKALNRANLTERALIAHYTKQNHTLYNVSTELVMSYSLTAFDFCRIDFREEIEEVLYKLDSILTTSKTSILIITPEYFKKVLNVLQDDGISTLYPSTSTFIPEYYSICNSAVKKSKNILYVIVQIPLKSLAEYNLYNIHYMHVPILNLPGWSRKLNNAEKRNYLAVSTENTKYIFFSSLKDSCTSSSLISSQICSSSQQIQKSNDDCLISSFIYPNLNNKDCIFIYEYNKKTEFIIVDGFWIGSLSKTESLNKQCNSNTFSTNINIARGIVKIPVSKNCTYLGNDFILPKINNNNNNNKKKLQFHQLSINFTIILNPIVIKLPNQLLSKLFLNKNNKLKYLTSHDINILNMIYKEKYFVTPTINFVIIIIIFTFVVLLIVIFIYYIYVNILSKRKKINTNNRVCQNEQYFSQAPQTSSLPQPPPPPPPLSLPPPSSFSKKISPIYETCDNTNEDTYISMH